MAIEVALVFDKAGHTIDWHCPQGCTSGSIPDSHDHFMVMLANLDRLGGTVHVHPWHGVADPSYTDITTWSAMDRALGRRLWAVATFTEVNFFRWIGPGKHDYFWVRNPGIEIVDLEELRRRAREGVANG